MQLARGSMGVPSVALAVAPRTPERCIVHTKRSHALARRNSRWRQVSEICRAECGDTADRREGGEGARVIIAGIRSAISSKIELTSRKPT